ncbi:hypothetical protein M1O19_02245 [Dehalococcoidia bacterium]|nr:hypothetical protein [Dehalococcoidia bacterium]
MRRYAKWQSSGLEESVSSADTIGVGKALEFHHLDSSKDFGISEKGHARSWERVKAELERCVLLCANCRREVRAGLQLPWETMDEKPGEFSEALWGNPERSLSKGK